MMSRIKIIWMFFILLSFTLQTSAQRSKSKKKLAQQQVNSKKKPTVTKKKIKDTPVSKKQLNKVEDVFSNNSIHSVKQVAQIDTEELKDTIGTSRVVVITSTFKPSLKYAAKINFTAASTISDSSKFPLTYKVPSSNLFFSYHPISIQPLALPTDSGWIWQNSHQIKLGAGNLNSFLAEGKFAFGDGRKSITQIETNFLSSKSKIFAQQISKFGLDVKSIIKTSKNLEWTSRAFFNTTTQFRYGFFPSSLVFSKDQLQQTYNSVALEIGLTNTATNEAGIHYHPQLSYHRFTDNVGGSENNIIIKAPLEKSFGKMFSFKMGLTADFAKTHFNLNHISNKLLQFNTALVFTTPNFKLNIGLQPSWNNDAYSMQPDISIEAKLNNTQLMAEAGWVGYFNKNSYRSLVKYNSWIGWLTQINNTSIKEQYVGLKGVSGNHLSYHARASFLKLQNQPLFLNDAIDGRYFITSFESDVEAIKIHGELTYSVQEMFSFMGAITATQYNIVSSNAQPWGLIPFQVSGTALWKPIKDLQVNAAIFYNEGGLYKTNYRNDFPRSGRLAAAVDLNVGGSFSVRKNLNLWLQMNNLFNNMYQRWNQYPVFGFNVMAGVVYSFK